jgi:hypothetical protein
LIRAPNHDGGSRVNLMAELEVRLGGTPLLTRLHGPFAGAIPEASTYVLVLFAHIDALFPTTPTVSLPRSLPENRPPNAWLLATARGRSDAALDAPPPTSGGSSSTPE